jgi:hypothetical protein
VQAKKLLRENNVQADLRLGSMFEQFPYEDGFFGAVIATRVIQHGYISSIRKVV